MSAVIDQTSGTYTRDELARRWAHVVEDPALRNLPYRMELNRLQDFTSQLFDGRGERNRSRFPVDLAKLRSELQAL